MAVPCAKRLLLSPQQIPSLTQGWRVLGVFNPGVVEFDNQIVFLLRVVEAPEAVDPDHVALPRWDLDAGKPVVDLFPRTEIDPIDQRVTRHRPTNRVRLTFLSYLRVAVAAAPTAVPRLTDTYILPEFPWETFGVEDPRVTRVNDEFVITYVAVSPYGVATALATTTDFRHFRRRGIIFPPENKDVVLFPERIGGRYAALHRPAGATRFCPPETWAAYSPDLVHWGEHHRLAGGKSRRETDRIGPSVPPLRVEDDWLAIYHGAESPAPPEKVGRYTASAWRLAGDAPHRIIARTDHPILEPTEPFEQEGFVPNVVFPTGAVLRDGRLYLYYGAADTATAVAEMALGDVLEALTS
ncbi:glycoside hydrolase family 130 protein [Thermostilla marina]